MNTKTKAPSKAKRDSNTVRKVTMIVEFTTPEMFDWAMWQAVKMGREMWLGVAVHHKDDPLTRVTVRTTKLRKRKRAQQ